MDTRGAVVVAVADVAAAIVAPAAGSTPWHVMRPVDDAYLWLYAASSLQALAVHVRQSRGDLFGVDTRDVETLTVEKLAALVRAHSGAEGQGFELAVCDALNAGDPNVVEPVREALHAIGVQMKQPRGVVMGLEKATEPGVLAAAVADALGTRRLLTGKVGAQPIASRAVARLLEQGTAITQDRGALAAADLLVYDGLGGVAVTASVKSSNRFRLPTDPCRLWITRARAPSLGSSCLKRIWVRELASPSWARVCSTHSCGHMPRSQSF